MTKKKLIIVGAGDFGQELLSVVLNENLYKYENVSFIDDLYFKGVKKVVVFGRSFQVIDSINNHLPLIDSYYISCIADPHMRALVVERLKTSGAKFTNIISKKASVVNSVVIGNGCIVFPNCYLSNNVKLLDHAFLNFNTILGHDSSVGRYTVISPNCAIGGHVAIEEKVFIGTAVSIIPGVRIYSDVTIGAGVCVVKPVPSNTLAFNNFPKYLSKENI